MGHPRSRRDRGIPSATGVFARVALAHAQAAGADTEALLKSADLTRQQIHSQRTRIATREQIKLVNLIAEALADDSLGFHLAQTFDLREIGLLYYVLASSSTLVEALQRGARYSTIVNEGVALTCRDTSQLTLTIRYVGVSRHLDRHQMEFWMGTIVRICRQLTGLRLLPVRVRLAHRDVDHLAEFSEYFGSNIEFGATADDIAFEKRAGQLPVVSADPYLNRLLVGYCEEALARRRSQAASFRSTVENAVVPLLPHGRAKSGAVARDLGVSSRTLARRLADEGLTFSGLVQNMRAELAKRYLSDEKLSISQVAWLLGYREVGAFSHAFKRRTGHTPREARARMR